MAGQRAGRPTSLGAAVKAPHAFLAPRPLYGVLPEPASPSRALARQVLPHGALSMSSVGKAATVRRRAYPAIALWVYEYPAIALWARVHPPRVRAPVAGAAAAAAGRPCARRLPPRCLPCHAAACVWNAGKAGTHGLKVGLDAELARRSHAHHRSKWRSRTSRATPSAARASRSVSDLPCNVRREGG